MDESSSGEHDELMPIDEESLNGWRDALASFKPLENVFAAYGYSKDTAFIAYTLNRIANRITFVEDAILNDE